jgi:predicted esterase
VRAARGASPNTPQQVIVALHGMGGNGEPLVETSIEQADRYGWLLVAPRSTTATGKTQIRLRAKIPS